MVTRVSRVSRNLHSVYSGLQFHVCVCVPVTEEVLQTHIAHWWSPDGLRLAYMTINDTLVPSMDVPFFTGTPYPSTLEYRYPKASLPGSKTYFISVYEIIRIIECFDNDSRTSVSMTLVEPVTRQEVGSSLVSSRPLAGRGREPHGAPVGGEPQRAPAHRGDEETG